MTTEKTLNVETTNELEAEVLEWINDRAVEYDNGWHGVLKDLAHGGCSSGIVSHLVYNADGAAFYDAHQETIDAMAYEAFDDAGCGPDKLFGDNWDKSDPFARTDANKTVLAWFAFEETARALGQWRA